MIYKDLQAEITMGGPTVYGMVALATSQLRTEDEATSEDEEGPKEVGSVRHKMCRGAAGQWWRSDYGTPQRLGHVEGRRHGGDPTR